MTEAVFLWAATFDYALLCVSSSSISDLLSAEPILKLAQLPLGLLLWRVVLPGFQQQLRPWGNDAATPLHVSLQLGFLHVAQPMASKAVSRIVRAAVRTSSEVQMISAITTITCIIALVCARATHPPTARTTHRARAPYTCSLARSRAQPDSSRHAALPRLWKLTLGADS